MRIIYQILEDQKQEMKQPVWLSFNIINEEKTLARS